MIGNLSINQIEKNWKSSDQEDYNEFSRRINGLNLDTALSSSDSLNGTLDQDDAFQSVLNEEELLADTVMDSIEEDDVLQSIVYALKSTPNMQSDFSQDANNNQKDQQPIMAPTGVNTTHYDNNFTIHKKAKTNEENAHSQFSSQPGKSNKFIISRCHRFINFYRLSVSYFLFSSLHFFLSFFLSFFSLLSHFRNLKKNLRTNQNGSK